MSEFINTVDVVGDEPLLDSLIEGTITEYKDNVITRIGAYAFGFCTNLTTVDVPSVIEIKSQSFQACSNLNILILRNETMCTLATTATFSSTPIANGTGYIYVPKALIEDYKVETNWATFADQFRALEDYTVDGTITGELDETKI